MVEVAKSHLVLLGHFVVLIFMALEALANPAQRRILRLQEWIEPDARFALNQVSYVDKKHGTSIYFLIL